MLRNFHIFVILFQQIIHSFIKYLESVGSVPYVKTVSLNKNAIKNLMFWMYNEFNFQAKLDFIKEKLSYANVLDENNSVTFIFFDNIAYISYVLFCKCFFSVK